jgi:hypothetical protein
MKRLKLMLAIMAFLAWGVPSQSAQAQDSPVQVALFNPIQLVSAQKSIMGIRWNIIYGKNASVTGLDIGMVNHTTSGTSVGVQFGLVGYNESNFTGWMDNSVNITKGKSKGVQLGFVNYARSMNGVQLGFVNYAGSMEGLQIGLVNVITQGGAFPVFPIVNWSF